MRLVVLVHRITKVDLVPRLVPRWVLQEREVVRLGARKPIPLNACLIAATNVRLEEAVLAGHFREDFFYRLRVANLALPALRERPGDILPLALYFVDEYRGRPGYGEYSFDAAARQKLQHHQWPGNIRELENAIHHALLICKGNLIGTDDLQLSSLHRPRGSGLAESACAARSVATTQLEQALHALFDQGGDGQYNLDRHWRNARTQTLHDPVGWKYHAIGNYVPNGVHPPRHSWI